MLLLKRKCYKEGFKDFFNLYLVWRYKNKVYSVLVRPSFNLSYKLLLSQAVSVPDGEPFDNYI